MPACRTCVRRCVRAIVVCFLSCRTRYALVRSIQLNRKIPAHHPGRRRELRPKFDSHFLNAFYYEWVTIVILANVSVSFISKFLMEFQCIDRPTKRRQYEIMIINYESNRKRTGAMQDVNGRNVSVRKVLR